MGKMPKLKLCLLILSNWSTQKPPVVTTCKRGNAGLRFAPYLTFIYADSLREQPLHWADRQPHATLCLA